MLYIAYIPYNIEPRAEPRAYLAVSQAVLFQQEKFQKSLKEMKVDLQRLETRCGSCAITDFCLIWRRKAFDSSSSRACICGAAVALRAINSRTAGRLVRLR